MLNIRKYISLIWVLVALVMLPTVFGCSLIKNSQINPFQSTSKGLAGDLYQFIIFSDMAEKLIQKDKTVNIKQNVIKVVSSIVTKLEIVGDNRVSLWEIIAQVKDENIVDPRIIDLIRAAAIKHLDDYAQIPERHQADVLFISNVFMELAKLLRL